MTRVGVEEGPRIIRGDDRIAARLGVSRHSRSRGRRRQSGCLRRRPVEAGAGAGGWRTRSTHSPARRWRSSSAAAGSIGRSPPPSGPTARSSSRAPPALPGGARALGPAGIRQIVAIATVNDHPVIFNPHAAEPGELVVASYRAAGPTRLGAVRKLHARRQGTHLLVSLDRARGAKSYVVLIALPDGLRTECVITRKRGRRRPNDRPAGRARDRACPPRQPHDRRRSRGGHEHRGPAAAAEAPQAPSSLSTGPEPGEVLRFAFA